jgi:hypothetical protein
VALKDHTWIAWGLSHKRCSVCGVLTDQADANCLRPAKTNRERMREALETVLVDFTVGHDGTVYYKGRTDGSKV